MTIPHAEIFAQLADYFPEGEVKFRDGQNGGHYLKAPSVMARLDSVLGPSNWWDSYHYIDDVTVECALTIRLPDGQVVTKKDVGLRKPPRADGKPDAGASWKAAYSDALKRAAVKFGVGRFLSKCQFADFVGPTLAAASTTTEPAALPSQARPSPTTEVAPREPARKPTDGSGPRTGSALYRWAKDQEEVHGAGLIKYLDGWGKLQEFPRLMKEWDADQVGMAHAEAVRKLRSMAMAEGVAL